MIHTSLGPNKHIKTSPFGFSFLVYSLFNPEEIAIPTKILKKLLVVAHNEGKYSQYVTFDDYKIQERGGGSFTFIDPQNKTFTLDQIEVETLKQHLCKHGQ